MKFILVEDEEDHRVAIEVRHVFLLLRVLGEDKLLVDRISRRMTSVYDRPVFRYEVASLLVRFATANEGAFVAFVGEVLGEPELGWSFSFE